MNSVCVCTLLSCICISYIIMYLKLGEGVVDNTVYLQTFRQGLLMCQDILAIEMCKSVFQCTSVMCNTVYYKSWLSSVFVMH